MDKPMFFEDFEIGTEKIGNSRTITECDIVFHAGHTGDFYPHHMDAEFCKNTDFKQRIAHGTMIFSIGVGLLSGDINPHAFSYGYNKLRFVKPVFIGDTIYTKATISEKTEHPKRENMGFVMEKVEITNQRQEVVLVCEHVYLVDKKL